MGVNQSRPVTRSPSAAFGRIRIDSPNPNRRLSNSSMRGSGHSITASFRNSFTASAVMHASTSLRNAASVAAEKVATETSPLIIRKLESLESGVSEGGPIKAPPLYIWIGPALVCALMYALYNIFIKKGSASIHPILGGVILQFVAAILGSCLLAILVWRDGGTDELNYDMSGIKFAILAGAAVGSAEILSFIVSGMGVQAMQSIPIIIGGSVLFGCVLGAAALAEILTYRGWIGVGMIAAGIALVGIDHGASFPEH